MFVILAGSGCRSNPRVRRTTCSPTGPERDLLQDGAADGEGGGGLSATDRQTGEQSSAYPCPIAKYVSHVPVPERLKEPRPLCCQSVLDSPSSAACCSPFGSGSFSRWAHSPRRPLWSWPPGLSSTHPPDIRPLRHCLLWMPAQWRVYLIVWPTVCRPFFVLLGLFSVYLRGVGGRTPGAFSSFCLCAHCWPWVLLNTMRGFDYCIIMILNKRGFLLPFSRLCLEKHCWGRFGNRVTPFIHFQDFSCFYLLKIQ